MVWKMVRILLIYARNANRAVVGRLSGMVAVMVLFGGGDCQTRETFLLWNVQ